MLYLTTSTFIGGLVGLCVLSWLHPKVFAREFHVANSHVFITDGSCGLGLAIAKKYASASAKVSIVARDAITLAAAKQEIEAAASSNHAVFTYECDVTDYEAVQLAVARANVFHARVTDHVICNAGISKPGLFADQDVHVFHELMDTNFFGALHTLKAALPAMIDSPLDPRDTITRRVVLISSTSALTTPIGFVQHAGSMSAVRGLSDALRNELKLYDVETSIFFPDSVPHNVNEDNMRLDAVAQALLGGLARYQYAITDQFQFEVMRALSNGVAPRSNTPLEAILLPLCTIVQIVFLWYSDWVGSHRKDKK